MFSVVGRKHYYFVKEQLGSVKKILDKNNTVVNEYDYKPFGGIVAEKEGVENRYLFTGRERINYGVYYYRARVYLSELRRFGRYDPVRGEALEYGSWNQYSYVGGNPINWIDPLGMKKKDLPDWLKTFLERFLGKGLGDVNLAGLIGQDIGTFLSGVGLLGTLYSLTIISESIALALSLGGAGIGLAGLGLNLSNVSTPVNLSLLDVAGLSTSLAGTILGVAAIGGAFAVTAPAWVPAVTIGGIVLSSVSVGIGIYSMFKPISTTKP